MSIDELNDLAAAARDHADHVQTDITNAGTRVEHIRLTGLAVEARALSDRLDSMLAIYRAQQ